MLINIGFGNIINTDKIITMISPDSAPAKRLLAYSKEKKRLIDATQGRKTKAIIIMENDSIVLSALQPDTIAGRFEEKHKDSEVSD